MRVTAIQAQTEQKRQDSSARHTEKKAATGRDAAASRPDPPSSKFFRDHRHPRGEKHLSREKIQAILLLVGTPLGIC